MHSVSEYQSQFEELSNQVTGLSEEWLISLFTAGLQEHLKCELMLTKPETYVAAVSLARLHEQKHMALYQGPKYLGGKLGMQGDARSSNYSTASNRTVAPRLVSPMARSVLTQNSPQYTPVNNSQTSSMAGSSQFRRLAAAEIKQKREKGLCYYCDEKYTPSHRCKVTCLLLLGEEEVEEIQRGRELIKAEEHDTEQEAMKDAPEISLNAMEGQYHPSTLRMQGTCQGHQLMVLIDGGSTHNFIKTTVASKLALNLISIPSFQVMVGSGDSIECMGKCKNLPIMIQGHLFTVEAYVLDLKGADIVLGVQWMMKLGEIRTNYQHLTMQFEWNGTNVKLQGERLLKPRALNEKALQKMVASDAVASFFHLRVLEEDMNSVEYQLQPTEVQEILNRFSKIFEEPRELPPCRTVDHHIHLLVGAEPVSVRPYKYPRFQKEEIEKLVEEMLQSGVIRDSHSAFSSPILLVKKKDGGWRFCVDYRALNTITVKDKFPIPTIEEILDELFGAEYFSKIDLWSGYHQIRMHEADIHKTAFRTHLGHYEFVVMPFGLTNAPSTFQATMNKIFQPYLRRFIAVFFDDILVYSHSKEEHFEHLQLTLTLLEENQFFAKMSKCLFCAQQVEYLGHVVSAKGVQVDPSKITAIMAWPRPVNMKQLRGFLGRTGYYRRFVAKYA